MVRKQKGDADVPKANGRKRGGGYARDIIWVNTTLNNSDIERLDSDMDSAAQTVFDLCEGLQADQTLSLKVDEHSGRWLAILFDRSGAEGHPVCALSLRAATPFDALIALAYVAVVKLPGEWQTTESESLGRFG